MKQAGALTTSPQEWYDTLLTFIGPVRVIWALLTSNGRWNSVLQCVRKKRELECLQTSLRILCAKRKKKNTMCRVYFFVHLIQKKKTQKVLVTQSCPTLCDPMGCSPPGSSDHVILQARILEWVAISYSRGSSWPEGLNPGLLYHRQILYCLSQQFCPSYAEKENRDPT